LFAGFLAFSTDTVTASYLAAEALGLAATGGEAFLMKK
jgi:hypothetical protein